MTTYIKQKLPALVGILLFSLAIWAGCKKPNSLGIDLIDDESEYVFSDTVEVRCTIEREDSSLTSDRSSTAEYFLCGELNDPQFGKSTSNMYALMLGEALNPNFDTTTQAFDSIVLYLRYASAGFYGDTLTTQTLRVLRMDDGQYISNDKDYYSNQSFSAGEELGSLTFSPRPNTQDSLFGSFRGPYLRVVLKPEFGQELFKLDSASYSVDSLFFKKLRGLKFVSSSGGTSPGIMMAFNLNESTLSRMRLYYHEKSDSTAETFDYFFKGANKFTSFEHDHSGSPAGQLIGQEYADEKLYVQGMHGVRVKIEFPQAHRLDNIAVNQAQLVLTVADETPNLPAADQLFFTQLRGDTIFDFTSDIYYSFGSNLTGGFLSFGGTPQKVVDNGTTVTRYRLTLSEVFQHMVDDDNSTDTKNRTVYLGVFPRSRTAERVVLHGPKSLTFPAKLELKYTKVK
ncbi:MAG: DUF4270 domain-containing protein [Lewinellaceae bacterium]|nr:DUF4270 domain-containing protein [Lewinellaceae bacterium]